MKKRKKIIVLPEYCGMCGTDLEGGVTCPYCGEQVIYSDEMFDAYAKEVSNASKQKKFMVVVIIAILVIVAFAVKDIFYMSRGPSDYAEVVVTDTPVPTSTILVTETPVITQMVICTPTAICTPTGICTPTLIVTQKPKKKKKLVTKEPVVTHNVENKGKVTAAPKQEEVYADKLVLPEAIGIKKGNQIRIPLECSPSSAKIAIVTSNNSVVGVSGKMLIARNPGTCSITVTSGSKSVKCKVTVTE